MDGLYGILDNKDIEIYSDGSSTRTFCYISDAITGYLLALLSKDKGEVYNIGSAAPEISMSDLANLIIEISNSKSKIVFKTNEDIHYLTNNPQRRCPDISKAKNKLNFSPNISLGEGLGYTYKYYSDRINEN